MEKKWTYVGVEKFKGKEYMKFSRTDDNPGGPQFFNLSRAQVAAIMDVSPEEVFGFVDGAPAEVKA